MRADRFILPFQGYCNTVHAAEMY